MKYDKHGMSYTKIYGVWHGMNGRCHYPKHKHYKNYGGRGISVCEEWKEFIPFYEWAVANGYQENLTLDRIDVNGNYCPENCRWVDRFVQNNNKRGNRYIEFEGKKQTLTQWAKELGIKPNSLIYRISNHGIEKSLSAVGNRRGKTL
jgi:hypothetical protein